jgi:predicted HTH domain antitoxin
MVDAMETRVKDDILAVLDRAIEILKVREEKDVLELSELSDHTIHNAATFQDPESISIAVLIYAIYKVIERPTYVEDKLYKDMESMLLQARVYLVKDETENYIEQVAKCFDYIAKIDQKLKMYIEEVITKAKIKKGSKIFEHGISIGRAAELLGISQWELMSYVGHTQIYEKEKFVDDVKDRIKFTRRLFKK